MTKSSVIILYTIVCAIISGVFNEAKGQDKLLVKEIKWGSAQFFHSPISGNASYKALCFENAVYNNPLKECPIFKDRIKVPASLSSNISLTIKQIYYENVPQTELEYIPEEAEISDSITLNYSIVYEKKQAYIVYSFAPIRRNKSGQLERVKIFSLKIDGDSTSTRKKAAVMTNRYASNSVLASGSWFKFYVSETGVYRITYDELKNLGLGSPENVRIYGNGGKVTPEIYTSGCPDDLNEIPIMLVTGSDGVFNSGDYLCFYAQGPITWSYNSQKLIYEHAKHPFTDKTSYFITSLAGGKRVGTLAQPTSSANINITSFDGLYCHEENLYNVLKSGQAWYGEQFGVQTSYTFSYTMPELIKDEAIQIQADVVGRSSVSSYFSFLLNSQTVGKVRTGSVDLTETLGEYAKESTYKGYASSALDNVSLTISYDMGGLSSSLGWLKYFRLISRQNLSMSNQNQLLFRDIRSVGSSNVGQFTISNAPTNLVIWDVTSLNDVSQMQGQNTSGSYVFSASTESLHEYAAFVPSTSLLSPKFISTDNGAIANQNLHATSAPDMVIVSHSSFLRQANELADFHSTNDGLKSLVVTPEQIYNEFSSGMPCASAIRNFMKMYYDRAGQTSAYPKYLLLFGDGSYDNKTEISTTSKNTNYIITYESVNSLHPNYSYVTDDYFGLLDDNEAIETGLLDIGIGRFPVQDTLQANVMIEKVKRYYNRKYTGDWHTNICLTADDEDNNLHMSQADSLARFDIKLRFPAFNIEKIYLDAYQQVPTSTGERYPDVNVAILNQLNKGVLIFNYTGHGGERGLAQEQIMNQTNDIKKWKNERLPLFVTATCEFSRFDKFEETTAGEDVLLNEDGGGIGLLTTTRVVFSDANFQLNQQFYRHALTKSADNPALRLGDMLRLTKNNTETGINKLCFTLLGDPALSLAVPDYFVKTDSINHQSISQSDTLRSCSTVSIAGYVTDASGNFKSDYNGLVYPTIFDKSKHVTTLANDGGTPFEFDSQDNILFRGKATVTNGRFSFDCILPRDMDYNFGNGRLSYFATNGTTDAWGQTSDNVIVGGIGTSSLIDNDGPTIRLFMNDTSFVSGGITDPNPTLLAKITDANGINPGGNGIGHDILAIIDEDVTNQNILNNMYQSDLDTYQKGTVEFKFTDLSPGTHTVRFKIWDILNNSSEASLNFRVVGEDKVEIQRLYNYPNPFRDYTYFVFEHNLPDQDLSASIQIYSLDGGLITTLNAEINSQGYTSSPIYWNGTNERGNKIRPGIYLYRVVLRSEIGTIKSKAQKLVIF